MAKSEKITQRELKQPDTFQRIGFEAQEWLIERQTLIGIGFLVLVLGGAAVAVFNYFSERSETRAAKELGAALEVLERPVVPAAEGAQPTTLPGEQPPFQSPQEKDQALVKALTDFRAAHSGTEAARTAALPLGKAQYRLGSYDAALAAFGDYLQGAPQNDPMRVAALEGQGYAYEAQQKYDEALRSFEAMSQVEGAGYLEGMGQYHRARILILQGKKEEAAEVLVKIPVEHKDTAAARLASDRTALLAAQGVKIPTPAASASAQDGGA